jgi:hypothetical protein
MQSNLAEHNLRVSHLQHSSFRVRVFIVACAYFGYAQYMLVRSLIFSSGLVLNFSTYQGLMKAPWWIATFYSSELGGTLGVISRSAAGVLALYCASIYLIKKNQAWPRIRGKIGALLVLEAGYYLSLIPTVWLGFVFPSTNGKIWYFDTTPVLEVFFVAGIVCLAEVLVIPAVLLKLRSRILRGSSREEILKWSFLVGISYFFVVFWLDATMQWTGMISSFGMNLLIDPVNIAGFLAAVLGLFLVAAFGLVSFLPAIKKLEYSLNLKHVGAVLMGFGSYFAFGTLIYFIAGGYSARPYAWYEIIVPHNGNLWCLVFLFAGLPLIAKSRSQQNLPT